MASETRSTGLGDSLAKSGGQVHWTNPTNIYTSNNVYATAPDLEQPDREYTHWLRARDFGFSIPAGATIDGIKVEIGKKADLAGMRDSSVKIVWGSTPQGDEKALVATWGTSDAYSTYGGATDLWGLTWEWDDFDEFFGVALQARMADPEEYADAYVDHIRITVYYTELTIYTLTADAGSYTETGTATNLLKSSLVGIGTGTYAETGQAVSLLKSSKITIGAGSYALSGQAVGLFRNRTLSVVAGSYVITGTAVNLRYTLVPPVVYEGERKAFTIFKSELLWVLGNRSSADINFMEGELINDAYQGLCSKNKFWRFEVPPTFNFPELDTKKLVTGNNGDAYIPKPPNALLIHTVWDMTNDKELDYKDHTWYVAQTGRAGRGGKPSYWIPYSDKIYLYPTLNAEYNLAIYYRKRPDALTGIQTSILGEQWDEPILMLATIRGLMALRDFEKAKEWRERFITTVQGLMGMQVRQARYTRGRLQPTSRYTQKHGY